MRELLKQLEAMHMRIAETATSEQSLVKALGEALNRLDEQLLADVQTIATEHEARRGAILDELQGLAAGIGMFRPPLPAPAAPREIETDIAYYAPPNVGDWRQATSNIRDDLGGGANAAAAVRPLFPEEQHRSVPSLTERRRRVSGA